MAVAAVEERSELEKIVEELRGARDYIGESQLQYFAEEELKRRHCIACGEKGHPNAYPISRPDVESITQGMHCPDCSRLYFRGVTDKDVKEYWALRESGERKD